MANIIQQSTNYGVEIVYDSVKSVDFSNEPFKCFLSNGDVYILKYIIIATGANVRFLNIEGESEYKGKGVSYCAVCDGTFYKNKNVAVIGGGVYAGTEELYLSRLCNKVYLIHRRDKFRMDNEMLKKGKSNEK